MTLNEVLLRKTRDAGAKLRAAEREVQSARAEYHALVRRIHLAGGTLREIAQALELSHQRVQQIVASAGGNWLRRVWGVRITRRVLECTFCKRSQREVARLIAGPRVYICDDCVTGGERLLSGSNSVPGNTLRLAAEGAGEKCSFCGKRRTIGRPIVSGRAGICGECIALCRQILIDSQS
jgi:hypothetical protein